MENKRRNAAALRQLTARSRQQAKARASTATKTGPSITIMPTLTHSVRATNATNQEEGKQKLSYS